MLIGDLADEFQCLFSSACDGIPIVVMQFVKITKCGDECVCYYRIILLLLSYMSIICVHFVLKLL